MFNTNITKVLPTVNIKNKSKAYEKTVHYNMFKFIPVWDSVKLIIDKYKYMYKF